MVSKIKNVLFRWIRYLLKTITQNKEAAEEDVFIVDAEDFETVDVVAEPVVEATTENKE